MGYLLDSWWKAVKKCVGLGEKREPQGEGKWLKVGEWTVQFSPEHIFLNSWSRAIGSHKGMFVELKVLKLIVNYFSLISFESKIRRKII